MDDERRILGREWYGLVACGDRRPFLQTPLLQRYLQVSSPSSVTRLCSFQALTVLLGTHDFQSPLNM